MMSLYARELIAARKLKNDKDQLLENLNFQKKAKSAIKPIFKVYKVIRDNNGRPKPHECDEVIDKENPGASDEAKRKIRSKKTVTRCPHTEMKHYAKGMCNHCYHLYGRSSLATKCPHKEKMIYAKGMCQNCYFNSYNHKKRSKKWDCFESGLKVDK